MSNVSELIKVAQQNGTPLFKGETGHPFYGNQYVDAAISAGRAADHASKIAEYRGRISDHEHAAVQHATAHEQYTRAGMPSIARRHSEAASNHRTVAGWLASKDRK